MISRHASRITLVAAFGLFLAIAGSRLLLLKYCSTDLPQFDAWGVEGEGIYTPYFSGNLTIADFFAPCNEHRVALTRLLSLILLIGNGIWDNRMQAVVNALIYAAFAALLFRAVARKISGISRLFWGCVVLAAFASPFGWENALWGFQSQFYLLVALSVALLHTATTDDTPTYGRIALTGALQIAVLFTMASGMLASAALVAAAAVGLIRSWGDRRKRAMLFVQAVVSLGVILFWKLAVYVPAAGHDGLKAATPADFAVVLAHCLSWPDVASGLWWIVAWLPWAVLCVRYLWRKEDDSGQVRFALALGIWVLLQAAAIAYARNTLALGSKYADPLSLAMIVNGLALLLISRNAGRLLKPVIIFFALFWSIGNGYALYGNYQGTVHWVLPEKQRVYAIQIYKTRAFLATGNVEFLIPQGKHQIPERHPELYARRLTAPIINPILPRSVNPRYGTPSFPAARLSRMSDLLTGYSLTMLVIGAIIITVAAAATMFTQIMQRNRHD